MKYATFVDEAVEQPFDGPEIFARLCKAIEAGHTIDCVLPYMTLISSNSAKKDTVIGKIVRPIVMVKTLTMQCKAPLASIEPTYKRDIESFFGSIKKMLQEMESSGNNELRRTLSRSGYGQVVYRYEKRSERAKLVAEELIFVRW